MSHFDFAAHYSVPLADPDAPRPELEFSLRGEGRVRGLAGRIRRAVRGRRLAYVDSHFPWQRSGFRYADALALHEARPDTVFFSMYKLTDPFPAKVLPLAQFPRLAPWLGITDIYGVFLGFMAGVLGLRRGRSTPLSPIEGLDLSAVLRREAIRAHVGLYPGGGFVPDEAGMAEATRLALTADSVFSWVPEVVANVPGVMEIAPAVIDTKFYAEEPHDFRARPLQLLFAADARPRKGLDVALAAIAQLNDAPVHLHVVGPHDATTWGLDPGRATFHGWLGRDELRTLHRHCHVFISPVRAEALGEPVGDGGVTDGFPTAAAAEAMSSGLLLISANPGHDHRHLSTGTHYLEIAADGGSVAQAIRGVLGDAAAATSIARAGAARVRARLDVRVGARKRLRLMGIEPDLNAEVRALAASVEALGTEQGHLADELHAEREAAAARVEALHRELVAFGQLATDDEFRARATLRRARSAPDYKAPFREANPLVSICIPTHTNHAQLFSRSLPSVLGQDYTNLQVVVVGDAAPPETAAGIERIGDPRILYENLSSYGPYPSDPEEPWLVAGTAPINRAFELVTGAWVVVHNDDDALRPSHVSTLLAAARENEAEVAYGELLVHLPDGRTYTLGTFPPELGRFGWQGAIQHRAMCLFEFRLIAARLGQPGDWDRARRMLAAGVRFHMIRDVVGDLYASRQRREL